MYIQYNTKKIPIKNKITLQQQFIPSTSQPRLSETEFLKSNVQPVSIDNGVARIFCWGGPIFRDLRRPTRFDGGGG